MYSIYVKSYKNEDVCANELMPGVTPLISRWSH